MRIMVVRHILTGMCIQEICGWSETKWIRMVDDWLNFKPQARWYFIVPIIFMFWRVAHVRHGDGTWWRDHRVVAYFSQFLSHTWMVTCHDPGTETTSGASTLKSSHWAYWVNGKKQNIDFAHPALKVLMKISMLPQTFGTSTHVDGSWLTRVSDSTYFYTFWDAFVENSMGSAGSATTRRPVWPTEINSSTEADRSTRDTKRSRPGVSESAKTNQKLCSTWIQWWPFISYNCL